MISCYCTKEELQIGVGCIGKRRKKYQSSALIYTPVGPNLSLFVVFVVLWVLLNTMS